MAFVNAGAAHRRHDVSRPEACDEQLAFGHRLLDAWELLRRLVLGIVE